jgi:hypothetical protein
VSLTNDEQALDEVLRSNAVASAGAAADRDVRSVASFGAGEWCAPVDRKQRRRPTSARQSVGGGTYSCVPMALLEDALRRHEPRRRQGVKL